MKNNSHIWLEQLAVGNRLQITPMTGSTPIHYYSYYIGYAPNSSILVSNPKVNNKHFLILEGQWLNVRLMLRGGLYSFQSTVLHICHEPFDYIHISIPKKINHQDIRAWPRVTTSEQIEIYGAHGFSDGSTISVAEIINISIGGASVKASIQLGAIGSSVNIKGTFIMGKLSRKIDIPCTIRQIRIQEDKNTGLAFSDHGVSFELSNNNEEDKIFLYGYIYEQILYAKTRKLI